MNQRSINNKADTMIISIATKRFFQCPSEQCSSSNSPGEFNIEHCYTHGGKFGPWICSKCSNEIRFSIENDRIVDVSVSPGRFSPKLVLAKLDIDTVKEDLYFIVRDEYANQDTDLDRFNYNERSCPINFINSGYKIDSFPLRLFEDCFVISHKTEKFNVDPHGLIRYISAIPLTAENEEKLEAIKYSAPEILKFFGVNSP